MVMVLFVFSALCCGPMANPPKNADPEFPRTTMCVDVDGGFFPYETKHILDAFREWSKAVDGQLEFRIFVGPKRNSFQYKQCIASEKTASIVVMRAVEPAIWADHNSDTTLGLAGYGIIWLIPSNIHPSSLTVKCVAMHEIGHILGIEHKPAGLMKEAIGHRDCCLDKVIVEEVAERYVLSKENLHYCILP